MDKEDPALDELLRVATRDGINFLIRACIPDGSRVTAMPRTSRALTYDGTRVSQAFKTRATKVRLDDVEQALSALIQYA